MTQSVAEELAGDVSSVTPGGLAERMGVRGGDQLRLVNGQAVHDAIDVRFYSAEPHVELVLERAGKTITLDSRKTPDEALGLEFHSPLFDGVRSCRNNCFFCFVDGLPNGLRPSLYLKDDDYRLSFLFGNFVTLTNLSDGDWERLSEQRLSPLYLSVHTTDMQLRSMMLGNPNALGALSQIQRLASLGIQVHAQIVLCPGVNDGSVLEQTVADLAGFHPTVLSIGVVPVGVSSTLRAGLLGTPWEQTATPLGRERARALVRRIAAWQRDFRARFGAGLVYGADELYLAAGCPLPAGRRYDSFPQYENGIGMVRSLLDEWGRQRRHLSNGKPGANRRRATVACGELIAPTLRRIASEMFAHGGPELDIVAAPNRLFGPQVTVSGLLSGRDIGEALSGRDLGEVVLVSRSALNAEGEVFLDSLTPKDVEKRIARPLRFVSTVPDMLAALG